MANLRNITEIPELNELNGNENIIVEQDGTAKRIPTGLVGAQADWNEADETSPAYIRNKPFTSPVLNIYFADIDTDNPSNTSGDYYKTIYVVDDVASTETPSKKITCKELVDAILEGKTIQQVYPGNSYLGCVRLVGFYYDYKLTNGNVYWNDYKDKSTFGLTLYFGNYNDSGRTRVVTNY